jgi:hypothetical protein
MIQIRHETTFLIQVLKNKTLNKRQEMEIIIHILHENN